MEEDMGPDYLQYQQQVIRVHLPPDHFQLLLAAVCLSMLEAAEGVAVANQGAAVSAPEVEVGVADIMVEEEAARIQAEVVEVVEVL